MWKGRFRPASKITSIFGETYIFMEITVEGSDIAPSGCSVYTCWLANKLIFKNFSLWTIKKGMAYYN